MARRPNPGKQPASGGVRPNTLGLGDRELAQVLDAFDAEGGGEGARQRDFVRRPFRRTTLELGILVAGADERRIRVACRNISSGGISVLHSAYMHPGTRCRVMLPRTEGEAAGVEGEVVRCEHRQGVVHEIGIRFTSRIEVSEFVGEDRVTSCFTVERVPAEMLHGTLVHVDGSEVDRRIVEHFLGETHVRVRGASSAAAGEALARKGCDLILCELHLPEGDGASMLEGLRRSGVQTPAILTTADTDPRARERVADSPATAFLSKPVDQQTLLRALAEFLMIGRDRGDLCSTLTRDDPAAALVEGYMQDLRDAASSLDASLRHRDPAAARRTCLTLRGHAPTFGFEAIGRLAEEAARALGESPGTPEAERACRAVIAACRRARAWPEAA